jgi:hypothetical protein
MMYGGANSYANPMMGGVPMDPYAGGYQQPMYYDPLYDPYGGQYTQPLHSHTLVKRKKRKRRRSTQVHLIPILM